MASESWSDEEPSEAGDAEETFLGAGAEGGRLVVEGRRAGRGGAVGIAKVVLRCEGGSVAGVAAGDGATQMKVDLILAASRTRRS